LEICLVAASGVTGGLKERATVVVVWRRDVRSWAKASDMPRVRGGRVWEEDEEVEESVESARREMATAALALSKAARREY